MMQYVIMLYIKFNKYYIIPDQFIVSYMTFILYKTQVIK